MRNKSKNENWKNIYNRKQQEKTAKGRKKRKDELSATVILLLFKWILFRVAPEPIRLLISSLPHDCRRHRCWNDMTNGLSHSPIYLPLFTAVCSVAGVPLCPPDPHPASFRLTWWVSPLPSPPVHHFGTLAGAWHSICGTYWRGLVFTAWWFSEHLLSRSSVCETLFVTSLSALDDEGSCWTPGCRLMLKAMQSSLFCINA